MAKRPSGFPKELSEPIKWNGPKLSEMEDAKSSFAPSRGLLDYGPNTPLSSLPDEERERIVQQRHMVLTHEEAANKEVRIERFRKLLLLCKHFNIEVEDNTYWPLRLCMALAGEFFEGMKVNFEERRGRPKKWNESAYLELWAAIEDIKIDRQCGDADACRFFARRASGRATEREMQSIQARLTEARNPRKNLFAKMFQGEPEYEQYMIDVLIRSFGPEDSKNALSDAELMAKYDIV